MNSNTVTIGAGPSHKPAHRHLLQIHQPFIEAHAGHLWPQPNPGPGATFFINLPAAPERPGESGTAADITKS